VRVPSTVVKDVVGDLSSTNKIKRGSFETRNGRMERPGYLILIPASDESHEGDNVLRAFLNQLRSELDDCRHRFTATGTLTLRFVLPGAGEVNDDGIAGRVSFRLSGPAATTPVGACLQERIAEAVSGFTVPPGVSRAEASKTIDLP
jgi:hypothetical protein